MKQQPNDCRRPVNRTATRPDTTKPKPAAQVFTPYEEPSPRPMFGYEHPGCE